MMGGRLRKFGKAARKVIAPVAFALMLPMCSSAHAMPKKPKLAIQATPSKSSLHVYSFMRASYGHMILSMFCNNQRKDLQDLQKNMRRPKDPKSGILLERRILLESASRVAPNKTILIASLFLNASLLKSVYPKNKSIVKLYARTLSEVGYKDLANQLMQWIKKEKGDVLSLFDDIVSCKQPGG
jgi:hypothetical protein